MNKRLSLLLAILLSFCLGTASAEEQEKVYKMGDYVRWWHSTNKPDWGGGADYPHDMWLTEANIKNGDVKPLTVTCTQAGTARVTSTEWESHGINQYPHTLSIVINMEPLGHYTEEYTGKVPATCTSNAKQTGACIRCDKIVEKEIPNTKTDHSFTNYVTQTPATCSSPAQLVAHCDYNCNTSDPIADPAGTLDPDKHVHTIILPAVAPTYTQTGLTEGKFCEDCQNIVIPQEIIPMLEQLPKTGDESRLILWFSAALLSTAGAFLLSFKRKES